MSAQHTPATQPATSQEGDALAYRYVRGEHSILEPVAHRWRNSDGWIETPLFAATPTPTTLSAQDLQAAWDRVDSLPPIEFKQDEADEILATLTRAQGEVA